MQDRFGVVASALSICAALTPAAAIAQPGGGDEEPIRLTLAIADVRGRQSEPAVRDLVARVADLSDGRITIEPVFGAGEGTAEGFEVGVAELLKAGSYDLAMTSTRAWDLAGVTSLEAFQTPFLIDSDALALAVARSDVSDRALAEMGHGVMGLAIWPEDLRHLFWFPTSGLGPDDVDAVDGATVLVIPSGASRALVSALGGHVYREGVAEGHLSGNKDTDAQAGMLAAFETGLAATGLPHSPAVVAGDLVLFPKYQALVASDQALALLTADQRRVLDEAVGGMQEAAFGRQPGEVALAQALCDEGIASVVRIGPEAVEAFRRAAQPVADAMQADRLTAELIADIEALKATTAPSPGALACDIDADQVPDLRPRAEATSPSADSRVSPLLGRYRADISKADLEARGLDPITATQEAGIVTLTLGRGYATIEWDRTLDSRCEPAFTKAGDVMRLTFSGRDACTPGVVELRFVSGDGELLPTVIATDPPRDFDVVRAVFERVWVRIE